MDGVREAFERRGYTVEEISDPGGKPFLAVAQGDGVRVDMMLAETAYQVGALRRAQDGYLSPEDVIVHKLVAWRPRDRDDIESILSTRERLDLAYIEKWAREWGVSERWRGRGRRTLSGARRNQAGRAHRGSIIVAMPARIVFFEDVTMTVSAEAGEVKESLGRAKTHGEAFTQFETQGGGIVYVAADRVAYIEDVSSGPTSY